MKKKIFKKIRKFTENKTLGIVINTLFMTFWVLIFIAELVTGGFWEAVPWLFIIMFNVMLILNEGLVDKYKKLINSSTKIMDEMVKVMDKQDKEIKKLKTPNTEKVDKLAKYIMKEYPEEITEGGAIDVAIKIMSKLNKKENEKDI